MITTINPADTRVHYSCLFCVTLGHLQEMWRVISLFNLQPNVLVIYLIISEVNILSAFWTHIILPVCICFMNKNWTLKVFKLWSFALLMVIFQIQTTQTDNREWQSRQEMVILFFCCLIEVRWYYMHYLQIYVLYQHAVFPCVITNSGFSVLFCFPGDFDFSIVCLLLFHNLDLCYISLCMYSYAYAQRNRSVTCGCL